MICRRSSLPLRLAFPAAALVALYASFVTTASAQRESSASPADEGARAAEYLQSVVESIQVQRDSQEDKNLLPRKSPILKYSDPARGYLASGVWRLGAAGRPKALVSLEYWLRAETEEPRLMFEFLSFTTDAFELQVEKDGTTWKADGTAPEFAPVPTAPAPASTDKQRLIQLRSLARRFTVSEKNQGEFAALRLLPQPIDRYDDPQGGILDGATFVFAYGTNPELSMLLECEGDRWRYALARMSWAELVVELDGKEVARFPQLNGFPAKGWYRSSGHIIAPVDRVSTPRTLVPGEVTP